MLALGAAQWSSLAVAMSWRAACGHIAMTYASVNGLQLHDQTRGSGRPLVLLHGGLLTIDLNVGPCWNPSRRALAVLPATTHVGVTQRPGQVLALITPFLDAT